MEVRRINDNELYHHGIKGQRWGVRRFQNPDGTLTEAGRRKYRTTNTRLSANDVYKYRKRLDMQSGGLISGLTTAAVASNLIIGGATPISAIGATAATMSGIAAGLAADKVINKKIDSIKASMPKKQVEYLKQIDNINEKIETLGLEVEKDRSKYEKNRAEIIKLAKKKAAIKFASDLAVSVDKNKKFNEKDYDEHDTDSLDDYIAETGGIPGQKWGNRKQNK